jgi:hypothetical protein
MTHIAFATIFATTLALTAPPMLPFTELNDKKIEVALDHMAKAKECTPTDMNVVMQLDHIHWKYKQMRDVFYKAAQDSKEGDILSAKDLGRMFDKIDASLEADREKDLQRIREQIERKEKSAIKVGKDA